MSVFLDKDPILMVLDLFKGADNSGFCYNVVWSAPELGSVKDCLYLGLEFPLVALAIPDVTLVGDTFISSGFTLAVFYK
jgi:hypothetical protein